MKTTMTWAGMALGLIMIFGLSSCGFMDCLKNACSSSSIPQDSIYYSEVGIRAAYVRARCRQVCMDVQNDPPQLVILPTGDSINSPLDPTEFSTCILLCNTNSILSPEYIALDRTNMRLFKSLGQKMISSLTSKMMILSNLPLVMLAGNSTRSKYRNPPLDGGDCGMSTCYGHVHMRQSAGDDKLRIVIPVLDDETELTVVLRTVANSVSMTIQDDYYLENGEAYRMAVVPWSALTGSPSFCDTDITMIVTRRTSEGRNISQTPLWLDCN